MATTTPSASPSSPSSPAANRFIGASVKRREDPRLLTGHGTYVDDIVLPGMLHAAFVRSPVARARIVSVDTAAAKALPGVHAVFTAADLNHLATGYAPKDGQPAPNPPTRALAETVTAYVGDPVAIVVADNRYIAEDGCDLVEVEYDPLPPVLGYDDALNGAERVHPDLEGNVASQIVLPDDPAFDEIFESAAHTFTETLIQHRYIAVPMECRGVIAKWEPYAGELTFWTSTQAPHNIRTSIAGMLEEPENRIRVIMNDVGGGFGAKGYFYREDMSVILAARQLGGTVKWTEDRVENLMGATHGREEQVTMRVAVDGDGTILAAGLDHLEDVGAYPAGGSGSLGGLVMMLFTGPYRVGKTRFKNQAVFTNTMGRGPYRGPWMMESMAREAMVDIVARGIGMDPLDFRRRNVIHTSELPFAMPSGMSLDIVSPEETLEQAATMIDYVGFRRGQAAAKEQGRLLGLGIGLYIEPSGFAAGTLGTEVAEVRIDASGKVTVIMGQASHGQSLETTMAQIVADHLGVDIDDVRYVQGDTAVAPIGGGTGGSRSAVVGGGAARKGALEMREKVLQIAAHKMEAAPEDLDIASGVISVKGTPTKAMTIKDVADIAYNNQGALPPGMQSGLDIVTRFTPSSMVTWSNACHMCTCEVDVATGRVTILRYIVSEDCGKMINPMVVDGQIAGGVVQGIGGVLYEHFVYDDEGNPLTTTFLDYLLPTTTEVPVLEISHIETPSGHPEGVKGMGEGGAIGAPPAVFNAVADALAQLGVTATEQPLTPARILDLIDQANARERR